jgi:hypothetical protein
VDVLPDDPVTPTTEASGSRERTMRANAAMAASGSVTTTVGASTARVPSTATAPLATA